jgi:hypothetical protein
MIIKPKFKVPPEFAMYCIDQGDVTRKIQLQRTRTGADTPTGLYSKLSKLKRTYLGADTPTGITSGSKSGGGDACGTGDLLFSWHCENVDVTLGTPPGCSLGDTVATLASSAVISATQKQDGSNSLSVPTKSDYAEFAVSSENIVKGEAGRVDLWIYTPDVTEAYNGLVEVQVDANNMISVYTVQGTVNIRYRGNSTNVDCVTTDGVLANQWWHVVASWSVAGSSGNHLRIGINQTQTDPTFVNSTDSITDIGAPVTLRFGDTVELGGYGHYIDNIKVYGVW